MQPTGYHPPGGYPTVPIFPTSNGMGPPQSSFTHTSAGGGPYQQQANLQLQQTNSAANNSMNQQQQAQQHQQQQYQQMQQQQRMMSSGMYPPQQLHSPYGTNMNYNYPSASPYTSMIPTYPPQTNPYAPTNMQLATSPGLMSQNAGGYLPPHPYQQLLQQPPQPLQSAPPMYPRSSSGKEEQSMSQGGIQSSGPTLATPIAVAKPTRPTTVRVLSGGSLHHTPPFTAMSAASVTSPTPTTPTTMPPPTQTNGNSHTPNGHRPMAAVAAAAARLVSASVAASKAAVTSPILLADIPTTSDVPNEHAPNTRRSGGPAALAQLAQLSPTYDPATGASGSTKWYERDQDATDGDDTSLPKKGSACLVCYRAKTSCDGERPCFRCVRLHKTAQCEDRPKDERHPRKKKDKNGDRGSKRRRSLKARSKSVAQTNGVHQTNGDAAPNTDHCCDEGHRTNHGDAMEDGSDDGSEASPHSESSAASSLRGTFARLKSALLQPETSIPIDRIRWYLAHISDIMEDQEYDELIKELPEEILKQLEVSITATPTEGHNDVSSPTCPLQATASIARRNSATITYQCSPTVPMTITQSDLPPAVSAASIAATPVPAPPVALMKIRPRPYVIKSTPVDVDHTLMNGVDRKRKEVDHEQAPSKRLKNESGEPVENKIPSSPSTPSTIMHTINSPTPQQESVQHQPTCPIVKLKELTMNGNGVVKTEHKPEIDRKSSIASTSPLIEHEHVCTCSSQVELPTEVVVNSEWERLFGFTQSEFRDLLLKEGSKTFIRLMRVDSRLLAVQSALDALLSGSSEYRFYVVIVNKWFAEIHCLMHTRPDETGGTIHTWNPLPDPRPPPLKQDV